MTDSMREAAQEASIEDGVASGGPVAYNKREIRRGKWTPEEEAYANRLIEEFKAGLLPIAEGTTLRTFLSKVLHCDPMRISKKFVGSNCIGKQVYRQRRQDIDMISEEKIARSRRELRELERMYLERSKQSSHQKASKNKGSKSTDADSKRKSAQSPPKIPSMYTQDHPSYSSGQMGYPSMQEYPQYPPPWMPADSRQHKPAQYMGGPPPSAIYGGNPHVFTGQHYNLAPPPRPSQYGEYYMRHVSQPSDHQQPPYPPRDMRMSGGMGQYGLAQHYASQSRNHPPLPPRQGQHDMRRPADYAPTGGNGEGRGDTYPMYKSYQSSGQLSASDIDLCNMLPDSFTSTSSLDLLGTLAELKLPSAKSLENLQNYGMDMVPSGTSLSEWYALLPSDNPSAEQERQNSTGHQQHGEQSGKGGSTGSTQDGDSTRGFTQSGPNSSHSPSSTHISDSGDKAGAGSLKHSLSKELIAAAAAAEAQDKVPSNGTHSQQLGAEEGKDSRIGSPSTSDAPAAAVNVFSLPRSRQVSGFSDTESRTSSINNFMMLVDTGAIPRPDPKDLMSSIGVSSSKIPVDQHGSPDISIAPPLSSVDADNATDTKGTVEVKETVAPVHSPSNPTSEAPQERVTIGRTDSQVGLSTDETRTTSHEPSPNSESTKKRKIEEVDGLPEVVTAAVRRPFTCM